MKKEEEKKKKIHLFITEELGTAAIWLAFLQHKEI